MLGAANTTGGKGCDILICVLNDGIVIENVFIKLQQRVSVSSSAIKLTIMFPVLMA